MLFRSLVRRADDGGTFVLLSAAMPSRLLDAFPPGVKVSRITLEEAVERVAGRSASSVTPALNPRGAFHGMADDSEVPAQARDDTAGD